MTPFTPLGLDHVVLRVRDQAAAQRFCPAPGRAATPARGSATSVSRSAAATWAPSATSSGARGVTLDGDIVDRRGAWGTGPSLYLRDPDGYLIELKPR